MNVNLRGRARQILEVMVKEGYANTRSEAVRLAIINFGDKHAEDLLVEKKLDKIDALIKGGKRKLLDSHDALGEYAKYLKG